MSKGEKVCLKQEGTKRKSEGEPRENHEKKTREIQTNTEAMRNEQH